MDRFESDSKKLKRRFFLTEISSLPSSQLGTLPPRNETDQQIHRLEGFYFRNGFPKYIDWAPGSGALLRLEDDLQQMICTFDTSCHLRGGLAVR